MSKRHARQRLAWLAVAALIALATTCGSAAGAVTVAHADEARATQAFLASANEVVSTLRLALQHEEDLDINAAAFLASHPHPSNSEFRSWAAATRTLERYPELASIGLAEFVPASGLAAYKTRMAADPRHPEEAGRPVTVTPPGNRPYYCLPTVAVGPGDSVNAGFDFCAAGISSLATRDSGEVTFDSFPVGDKTWLGVGMPVYRGGVTPATVAERRAKFIGWIGESLEPGIVLERALSAHPEMAVRYEYQHRTTARFDSGRMAPGARTVTLEVGSGWNATIYGPAQKDITYNGQAMVVLVAGMAVGLLLAALVFVLGTGRARARRMVEERTRQLRFQASHDALTGLPNRARILEVMEDALRRARDHDTPLSVMFIDLDGFKHVNDTLGHAAGDELLREVAHRLPTTLRAGETVGRLGGDEFVAVIEGNAAEAEAVALRIRQVLAAPVLLTAGADEATVTINSSIGIATGVRSTADDLLRDADVALYHVKKTGKNRYEFFTTDETYEVSAADGS